MTTRSGSARYDGFGKDGKGHVSTQSGVLTDQFYGFGTRSKTRRARIPKSSSPRRMPVASPWR